MLPPSPPTLTQPHVLCSLVLASCRFISSLQSVPKVLHTPSLALVSVASSQSVPCSPVLTGVATAQAMQQHSLAWGIHWPGIGDLCSHFLHIEISSLKPFFFHMASKKHPNMARSQAVLPILKADGSSQTCLCISKWQPWNHQVYLLKGLQNKNGVWIWNAVATSPELRYSTCLFL